MEKTIIINRQAFVELMKLKEEFDLIMESIELSNDKENDKEFMEFYEKSKKEIQNSRRQFSRFR